MRQTSLGAAIDMRVKKADCSRRSQIVGVQARQFRRLLCGLAKCEDRS
jgi:hypothetical protein